MSFPKNFLSQIYFNPSEATRLFDSKYFLNESTGGLNFIIYSDIGIGNEKTDKVLVEFEFSLRIIYNIIADNDKTVEELGLFDRISDNIRSALEKFKNNNTHHLTLIFNFEDLGKTQRLHDIGIFKSRKDNSDSEIKDIEILETIYF